MVEKTEPIQTSPKKGSAARTIATWITLFVIIAAAFVYMTHQGTWLWEAQPAQPAPPAPTPADVELYRFSDLKTNRSVNTEIWIKNIGKETAKDVSVFVRVRNQNGTVTYTSELDLTWQILGDNETCSATYMVPYGRNDTYLEHTIEVRWTIGMNSYLKKTDLIATITE